MKRRGHDTFALELHDMADRDIAPVIDWGKLAAAIARGDDKKAMIIAAGNPLAEALIEKRSTAR